jgi:hypothetical protein
MLHPPPRCFCTICAPTALCLQMMTTGGGWQDQVGGVFPGFKSAVSEPVLPLQVQVHPVGVPSGFEQKFSDHLVLIHTGGSRLARDLLQNVVRSWYHRGASIQKVLSSPSRVPILAVLPGSETVPSIACFLRCVPGV